VIDLGKARGDVDRAADGLLAARGALEEIDSQLQDARARLATMKAKADSAALQVVAAEIGPQAEMRAQKLAEELVEALAKLGWLSTRRAYWSQASQALIQLQGLAPRDWPMMVKIATESDSALERALVALANDPSTEVPAL
jgi:hypothetical protein